MNPKLRRTWWTLRIGLGSIFLIGGADKFSNLMTHWPMYVNDAFLRVIPVSAQTFMYGVGVLETLIGLAMLIKPVRVGAYLTTAWMLAVAANLAASGLYDLAARDVAIALGAFALAQLTEVLKGTQPQERNVGVGGPTRFRPADDALDI